MSETLPVVYLARHGETAWTISRQHTGLTDLPLTAQGEAEAARLGQRLERWTFTAVLTSPLKRAIRTCVLAGFGSAADIEPDLAEWLRGVRRSSERGDPGLPTGTGRYFLLGTASLSSMGYEHAPSDPVIRFWDEMPDERRVSPAPAYSRRGKVRQ